MKHLFVIILSTFLLGFLSPKVIAETSVNIENNGEGSTSDVHVENSVDNGESKTTVCINGKCETSQNGNVERNEGGAKVKVENSLKNAEGGVAIITPTPEKHPSASSGQDASKSAESSISAKKDPSTGSGQQFSLEQMMNNLRNFFAELFSQNK